MSTSQRYVQKEVVTRRRRSACLDSVGESFKLELVENPRVMQVAYGSLQSGTNVPWRSFYYGNYFPRGPQDPFKLPAPIYLARPAPFLTRIKCCPILIHYGEESTAHFNSKLSTD